MKFFATSFFFLIMVNGFNLIIIMLMINTVYPINFFLWLRYFSTYVLFDCMPYNDNPEVIEYKIWTRSYFGDDSDASIMTNAFKNIGFSISFLLNATMPLIMVCSLSAAICILYGFMSYKKDNSIVLDSGMELDDKIEKMIKNYSR